MPIPAKTDYCGLATTFANSLVTVDDAENLGPSKYQPQGQDGSFIATEVYGEDAAPTNSYKLKADIDADAGDLVLNSVVTIDNKKYALEQVSISTSGGSAPTIQATCKRVEPGATDAANCLYEIPAFKLLTKQHAQDIFSALTLTGSGCVFTQLDAVIGCTVNPESANGIIIASDANSGVITVSGTILQSGSTAPTLAAASGWVITQVPNCTNPENQYKSYAFEAQLILAKTAPSA